MQINLSSIFLKKLQYFIETLQIYGCFYTCTAFQGLNMVTIPVFGDFHPFLLFLPKSDNIFGFLMQFHIYLNVYFNWVIFNILGVTINKTSSTHDFTFNTYNMGPVRSRKWLHFLNAYIHFSSIDFDQIKFIWEINSTTM